MKLIEFKNGNIHLKIENEEKNYNKNEVFQELIETLYMHDACNDSCYTINEFEFSKLLKDETIILESWSPSQEEIEKFLNY